MKKLLAVATLMMAFNSYSQSYLILNNGVTLTTDKAGYVYDFNHFILPYKVNLAGGQFLVEDGKLVTVDEKGYLYRKDEKAPSKTKGKGANYVIADNGVLYAFDAAGFFYKYDKDSALKKANTFGGNFFTVKPNDKKDDADLYTVNSKGNYFKMVIDGLNAVDISIAGGNYFQTAAGVVYAVSKDGFVFSKADTKTGVVKKVGGNFFIDSNNALYTVSEDGFLVLPSLPATLKIANISKVGQNYMLDQDGKLFIVDSKGSVFEREMKGHNLKDVKVLSI